MTNSGIENRKKKTKKRILVMAGLDVLLILVLSLVWGFSCPATLLNPYAPPLLSHVTGSMLLAASDEGMLQFNKSSLEFIDFKQNWR